MPRNELDVGNVQNRDRQGAKVHRCADNRSLTVAARIRASSTIARSALRPSVLNGLFPGLDTSVEDLDVRVTQLAEFLCPTGSRGVARSASEKDQLAIFGQARELGLELLVRDGAGNASIAAFLLIRVGADQQCLPGLDPLDRVPDAYSRDHDLSP